MYALLSMGGVNITMRSGTYLNTGNPAGLTGLDSCRLVYEVGGMVGVEKYSLSGQSSTSVIGNLTNVGMGFRVLPRWYMAAGVTPLSSVGYAVTVDQEVEGTNGQYTSSLFEGQGGVYRVYFSNAIKLARNLSLGANLLFIRGEIDHSETQSSAAVEETSSLSAFYADFGLQFEKAISDKLQLTVGGVYGYKQRISVESEFSVSSSSGGGSNTTDIRSSRKYLPQYWGVGAGLSARRWNVATDYRFLQWSAMESDYSTITYKDQHRVSLGGEYLFGNLWKNPWRCMFGGGAYNLYAVMKKQTTMNYYISAGLGMPIRQSDLLSLGVRYDWQKTKTGIQQEKSFSVYLNITLSERIWKSKVQ